GADRLYRILITKSAWLIWKLRNKRRIGKEDDPDAWHSQQEIHNRWLSVINLRLHLDCLLTNTQRYETKALEHCTVATTWSRLLQNENGLPSDWMNDVSKHRTEVLVGIEPLRPSCPRPRGWHR
ncbi:hypothetical protein EDD18DRAFT_1062432, partial [Armillaria luteobubalina]